MATHLGPWILAAAVVLTMGGCAGSDDRIATLEAQVATLGPTPTSTPTATPTPGPTPTDPALAFPAEWDALLAAAQAEGEVVIFIAESLGLSSLEDLLPRFEARYGIKVIFSIGSSEQSADKILAERAGGRFELDIWMGASGTASTRLLPVNALRPIEPLLFHPEVLDVSAWLDGRHHWLGTSQKFVLAFAANASKWEITYNKNAVDPNEIQSIHDLLDPKWKFKIMVRNPRLPEAGAGLVDYYVHPDIGEEFLRKLLTEMDVAVADEDPGWFNVPMTRRRLICLFGCRSEAMRAESLGLPIEADFPHYLREGGRLSSGSGSMALMDTPKNPNAQRFFANWWLSKDGQEMMQEASGNDSLRLDIDKRTVAIGFRRENGVTYTWSEGSPRYLGDLRNAQDFASEALATVGK